MVRRRGQPVSPEAELRRIWLRIPLPAFYCKGLCVDSCGPIGLTPLERRLIETHTGQPLRWVRDNFDCAYLDPAGRCSIYEVRPTVCRLYGAIPELACEHGCVPPLPPGEGPAISRAVASLEQPWP